MTSLINCVAVAGKVPAYSMPADRQDLVIQRISCSSWCEFRFGDITDRRYETFSRLFRKTSCPAHLYLKRTAVALTTAKQALLFGNRLEK